MHELERISLSAYLPVYGPDAIEVGGGTCLRAPHTPGSPMLNRVVGIGVDAPVDEDGLDEALAAMGDTTLYVTVSPSATRNSTACSRPAAWSTAGAGCCSSAPRPAPTIKTTLGVVEVRRAGGRLGSHRRRGLRPFRELIPVVARVPGPQRLDRVPGNRRRRPGGRRRDLDRASGRVLRVRGDAPRAPGQGWAGGLFAARIEHALETGCTTLVTETGELREGSPSASYRNIARYGFEERFVVAHRLRQRRPG